jgi:hypothetical protein
MKALEVIHNTKKLNLSHSTQALGGKGSIAPAHSPPRHYMGISLQRHVPAAL